MFDNEALSSIASRWVETLIARGVTLTARGPRGLVMHPKSAFGEMSAEERATLKQHKAEIIEMVRARYGGLARPARAAGPPVQVATTTPSDDVAPTLALAPRPTHCTFCMRTPCVGPDHEAFETLHADDPAAYWIFRERLREKDNAEFEMRRRYGLTPVRW